MLSKKEAARLVNETWRYKSDGLFDAWSFSTLGDCDDYLLSILKALCGGEKAAKDALRRGDAIAWYARVNGDGHAVLEYDGEYIDNRTRHWVTDPADLAGDCVLKWKYPFAIMWLRMAIG